MIRKNIWLIGTGLMALEYSKILSHLSCAYEVIGRGKENCASFFEKTGVTAIEGGLEKFLQTKPALPGAVIVAVGIESLSQTTAQLLHYGVKYILLEKPGVGYPGEIDALSNLAEEKKATVLLAYNRRFYASVRKAKELIAEDKGVSSFQFEFTEWSHRIKDLQKHPAEHNNWFLGNSTHVIDTAFYLGGIPVELCAFASGSLNWHPASSVFAGAGVSDKGALFSYNANWEAPGRWVLEILTKRHRYIFKPLESLQVQEIGSVEVKPLEIDNKLDIDFKPGLYLQTEFFLNQELAEFCDIHFQRDMITKVYKKMSKY